MDNHYTKFPNYLFTELYQADISGASFRVFLYIYRMTAGYQKDSDRLSLSLISKETGLSKMSVVRSLETLKNNGFIKVKSKKKGNHFYETNTIKLVKGSNKNDTGGSNKNDTNSLPELLHNPIKGKEKPLSDGRFYAPSSGVKKILDADHYDDMDLGDEYE